MDGRHKCALSNDNPSCDKSAEYKIRYGRLHEWVCRSCAAYLTERFPAQKDTFNITEHN